VKERDLSFLEKAAFFAHDLKFRRNFCQKFVLHRRFLHLSPVPSFHFGDEMTSDNTNSFSADGGEEGKKRKETTKAKKKSSRSSESPRRSAKSASGISSQTSTRSTRNF
jgi:hypothetical protein